MPSFSVHFKYSVIFNVEMQLNRCEHYSYISANRIHISASTNNLLMKIKGFTTQRRGPVDIKVLIN